MNDTTLTSCHSYEILPHGVDGILVRFSLELTETANARAVSFRKHVISKKIAGVVEVASSLTSVRVAFDPTKISRVDLTMSLKALLAAPDTAAQQPGRLWKIPAAFGAEYAPQLAEAAELAGLSTAAAVAEITSQKLSVLAIGFAPGQPYLGLLPEYWNIPRQTALSQSVPRGALVAAVRQILVFAADAPTGWRQVGQTAFDPYRPEREVPFAFAPGDWVQFEQVSDAEMTALLQGADCDGGAVCERVP